MEEVNNNFIHEIIDENLKIDPDLKIHTRFPPEPNGYLHIGSAKAIYINHSIAKKYGGKFNLRFDDTNPEKEDEEYVNSIIEDLKWLGADPDGGIFYGSDYFDKCYEFAVKLIKDGKAYVDNLTQEEMREYRGTLTTPGKESPFRNRSIEENLKLFEDMKYGKFKEGECVLRAKIDMSSPNMNMRDPAIYRIAFAEHHRQGNKWCIYPLYDFAHPIQDALEGITHSLCSLEFENHRPLYDWVINNIDFEKKPHQYEFARLNVTHTVMSKRYLRELVFENHVDGWDDPRMPTLCGLRRRGYTASSIFDFIKRAGVSKVYSIVDIGLLEHCIREELNAKAQRKIAVLEPLKVTITNYEDGKVEYFDISNNPNDPETGTRKIPFTKTIYVEKTDFMEVPVSKFFRLKSGGEVRLMGAYITRVNEVIKDENGEVIELKCTIDPETGGKNPLDGRKVKGTIHWVSASHCVDADIRLYDHLFSIEKVNEVEEGKSYLDYLNEHSLVELKNCKLEESMKDIEPGSRFQFVRNGYFCKDIKSKNVYNRIVGLKDSFKIN